MAISQTTISLDMDIAQAQSSAKKISGIFGGLDTVINTMTESIKTALGSLRTATSKAFNFSSISKFIAEAIKSYRGLEKELFVLRMNFGKLKAAIRNAVEPIGAVFVPMINQAVQATTRLVKSIGQVISALFGGSVASKELGSSAEETAQAEKTLADSVGKAKRTLAGFDEINRLDSTNTGSEQNSVGTISTQNTSVLPQTVNDTLSPQLQDIIDKIMALIEPLRQIDFSPAVAAFGKLKEAVEPLGQALFTGLEWAYTNILVPLAAWTIENLLPAFLNLLSGAMRVLNEAIIALQPLATWLWDNFLQPIMQWTGGAIIDTLQWLAEKLQGISVWISENQSLVQTMTGIIGAFAAAWAVSDLIFFVDKLGGVPALLGTVLTAIQQCTAAKLASKAEDIAILALYAGEFVKTIAGVITQLATATANWVGITAAKVASTAADWAMVAATTAWKGICTAATAVTTAFGVAVSFLTSPIGLVVTAITALIAIIVLLIKNWDAVKAAAISVWDAIKEAFGSAWKWFKETLLDPLANGFKNMVNGIIGFINGMISGIVSGINTIINAVNKIKFAVPDWVPGIGGQTLGFNLKTVSAPQIPYLAKGAVLPANRPFLAMVGDQSHGTNVEAPLATIQEAVALVMNDQLDAMMAGFDATVEQLRQLRQTVGAIEVGDTVIGRAAERYNRKMAVVRGGIF